MVIKLKDGNIIRKINTKEYGEIDLANVTRAVLNGTEMPVEEALIQFCEQYGLEVESIDETY